jgi:hypothetical protein
MSTQGRSVRTSSGITTSTPTASSKRALPSVRMVEKKIRLTTGQLGDVAAYQSREEGADDATAIRSIFNAGVRALGLRQAA